MINVVYFVWASFVAQQLKKKQTPPAMKEMQETRCGFDPWVRKIPWRRKRHPTPVFLRGKFHAHKSLVGYSSWGGKESETTWWLTTGRIRILLLINPDRQDHFGFPAGSSGKCHLPLHHLPTSAGDVRDVVWPLGQEDPLEEGNWPRYPCLENPMDRGAWRSLWPYGHKELDTT